MTEPNKAAAELLEASVSGYAAAAASALLQDHDAIRSQYGPGAMASWKSHFVQRLLELAAAVRMGEPRLFAARIVWQQKAFAARESNPDDLRHALLSLKDALAAELPSDLRDSVGQHLQAGLDALDAEHELDSSRLDPNDASDALALKYIVACLEGDPARAIRLVLDAARNGMSIEEAYLNVLFPAQKEIGRMWHAAEASIADEHVVTETTRRTMVLLTHEHATSADTEKTILAAAVAGDAHDLGIRAVADFFQVAGWRAISLGSDVPTADLAKAAKFFGAELVVLSTTLSTQLKNLQTSIESIRATCGHDVKIIVGGHAFVDVPELWKSTGADGYASNPSDAVELGSALVGLPKSG